MDMPASLSHHCGHSAVRWKLVYKPDVVNYLRKADRRDFVLAAIHRVIRWPAFSLIRQERTWCGDFIELHVSGGVRVTLLRTCTGIIELERVGLVETFPDTGSDPDDTIIIPKPLARQSE